MGSQGGKRYDKISMARGHHTYKHIRTLGIIKQLVVEVQDGNEHDDHSVAVMKDGYIVGHSSREFFF